MNHHISSNFTEFSEIDLNGYETREYAGWQQNDFMNTSMEDISFQDPTDFMPKYRSLMTDCNSDEVNMSMSYSYDKITSPPKLSKRTEKCNIEVLMPVGNKNDALSMKSDIDFNVPGKPIQLMRTHFMCFLNVVNIVSKVERCLNKFIEASYQFIKPNCMWEGIFVRGSSQCKFQISIFREDNSSSSYIIEGNRLSGDNSPFRTIFNSLKSEFEINDSRRATSMDPLYTSMPMALPVDPISDKEIASSLSPIIEMAKSKMFESQIAASSVLCDLSFQEDMQQALCEDSCLNVLVELLLVNGEFDVCRNNAICALANLSSLQTCQDFLANNSACLTTLLSLAVDGDYLSAELRRESARILANICHHFSSRIISVVGLDELRKWVSCVDNIKDERLRIQAGRAKLSLQSYGYAY